MCVRKCITKSCAPTNAFPTASWSKCISEEAQASLGYLHGQKSLIVWQDPVGVDVLLEAAEEDAWRGRGNAEFSGSKRRRKRHKTRTFEQF